MIVTKNVDIICMVYVTNIHLNMGHVIMLTTVTGNFLAIGVIQWNWGYKNWGSHAMIVDGK